jgi:hypothetical protein
MVGWGLRAQLRDTVELGERRVACLFHHPSIPGSTPLRVRCRGHAQGATSQLTASDDRDEAIQWLRLAHDAAKSWNDPRRRVSFPSARHLE